MRPAAKPLPQRTPAKSPPPPFPKSGPPPYEAPKRTFSDAGSVSSASGHEAFPGGGAPATSVAAMMRKTFKVEHLLLR